MGETKKVHIPDIGDFDGVEVLEVLVAPGDRVEVEQGLVTLESDKATMDVPSPAAGVVREVALEPGAVVQTGDLVLTLETGDGGGDADGAPAAQERGDDAAEEAPEAAEEESGDDDGGGDAEEAAPAPEERGGYGGRSAKAAGDEAGDGSAAGTGGPSGDEKGAAPARAPREARDAADLHAGLLVLGSGPGGYTAAFRAADLGLDVVLVERYADLGGVCLNVGCIPSKALLHAAKVIEEAAGMAEHGVVFGEPEIDLDRLRAWKDGVVGKLTGGLAKMAERRGVKVVRGTGTFASPHTLEVVGESEGDDGGRGRRTISFDQAIVAAGSRVIEIPGIPRDDPRVVDSAGALELPDVPERLLVVGGGIIGLEMATVYAALGAKVTIVELLDRLLPGADPDLVKPLRKRLAERATIHLETKVARVEATDEGLVAHFEPAGAAAKGAEAPEPATFDRVLVAVGRRPNGDRIGAEAAGIEVDERGYLPTDVHQRTRVPHIFAIGDVTGQPQLAHRATHQGKVAAEVAAGEKSAFDARVIPSVAYTDPEVAWVGLTEEEAKAAGTPYEKGTFPWSASGRALGVGRPEGLTKLLFDPATRRLVGAGIVGPSAGDLIAEAALAIEMGADALDVGLTIHPHPTLSETLAFAAEAYDGTITDLYLPKKKKR